MRRFEVGKTYVMESPCNQECSWAYQVVKRTAQMIWLEDDTGKQIRRKILYPVSKLNGAETVYPLGRYAMAPALKA